MSVCTPPPRSSSRVCLSSDARPRRRPVLLRQLAERLTQLKDQIHGALVDRVVEHFVDMGTPLKQFSEATLAPEVRAIHCCAVS